jgi:arylsulfatase A-like enzyme
LIARESLGRGRGLDVLCIVSGSTAMLGYETGARHPLMEQLVLSFDRQMERLLAQLAKTPGDGNYNLVLVGGHGAAPEPAPEFRDALAVNGQRVAEAVDRALLEQDSGRVEKYLYPFLYLDTTGFRDANPIRAAAAQAALKFPAVAGYYTAAGSCSTTSDWAERFRNSFHPKRSGDLMLSYRPEQIEDYGQGRGISYGSLYNYDAQVPLCFYGPQFRSEVFNHPVESIDLAPTLARVLGIPAPSSATGRVLEEALAE